MSIPENVCFQHLLCSLGKLEQTTNCKPYHMQLERISLAKLIQPTDVERLLSKQEADMHCKQPSLLVVLTVLNAQNNVSEVEPGLILTEWLVTWYLHDSPVKKEESN